ncbi:MAG: serine hydrolase [Phenylobacterium sp.]|nr:serine hydrolase [Phenylobacterium sp.]
MRSIFFAALVVATSASAAVAQEDAHVRALSAGYKAAFLCSGMFNAGRPEVEIAADDLEGIYPDYQVLVRTLPATVDREARTVSVAFDPKLPPRVAAWRPHLGCAQLPIGADPASVATLPRLDIARRSPTKSAWPDGDETAAGPNPQSLTPVLAGAFDPAVYGGKTTAVLVVRDGRIVGERYRPGYDLHTPQRTWSVAKSLTATVVGRAVELGKVKLDGPAGIPEWSAAGDPRAGISLTHLLHMASGLWTDGPGNRTDEIYVGGGLVTDWATRMPMEAAPGTRFRYANNDTVLAARAVRAALGDGQDALAFPFKKVLWRIGMNHTTPETDWQGNYILSSQVWTTSRDLARLGLLYLNDGVWNGERLLPEGWARFVATPAPAQPTGDGPGYGAFFWLYGPAQGLPEGTYAMNGNRGQFVFIVPSNKVVIVRRGFDAAGGPRFDEARFARDALAVVE